MKVDTPVATMGIRGTAVLVEIDFVVPGQGGAPPAKFQVLVEPDGTTGSYILFDKTTLTPIATVNQAGTQTIINGQGTVNFLSSAQLSPDAQKIITDVFSLKFTDLNNPNTKTTSNFTDSIVPETVFVKLGKRRPIPVTVQVIVTCRQCRPPSSTGTTTGSHDHIPGPAGCVATCNGAFTEQRRPDRQRRRSTRVTGEINYADINPGDVPTVKASFDFVHLPECAAQRRHGDADGRAACRDRRRWKCRWAWCRTPTATNTGSATWTYSVPDGAFDFLAAGETLTLTYHGAGRQQFRAEQRDDVQDLHHHDHRHQ